MTKNILWIMADQLRWDYLSCFGAKHIETPNLDRLAAMGVRFNRAYVQSPICGPSRMSFYTGRYVRSHGATWNGFPLKVGEPTLGDHLRELGVKCSLVGKTHMVPDRDGMARLGIEPDSVIGALVSECGFEVDVRDDGLNHSDYPGRHGEEYDAYLRANGFEGDNLWEEWANSAEAEDGSLLSGWLLRNSHLPARVPAEHSETAWLTTRGIQYIEKQGDQPWLCHLSYIKPHWPYLAPAPYNDMYSADDLPPVVRDEAERLTENALLQAWQDIDFCQTFSRDEVRDRVGPAYMGLIKQLDDEMGRLFKYLEESGRLSDTMIVFSSDHGDNMGDHWLGEKDLFYDCSARIPLIVFDPSPTADATRGAVLEELVEGIDLVPTFLEAFGGNPKPHILEGRSLGPLLRGESINWREFAFSEYDYSTREIRVKLGVDQADARLTMIFDGRWKLTHAEGFPHILYDLESDPDELVDRAKDPKAAAELKRLQKAHFAWARQHHARTTKSPEQIEAAAREGETPGIYIGIWDEKDLHRAGMRLPDKASG